MLISGVHFDFFFHQKKAELQVRRLQKISSPNSVAFRIPEKSQKKEMLGHLPAPWATLKSVKESICKLWNRLK